MFSLNLGAGNLGPRDTQVLAQSTADGKTYVCFSVPEVNVRVEWILKKNDYSFSVHNQLQAFVNNLHF